MPQQRIGIIGGGLAGAACAARLREAGRDVVVFDKGRGPGGRASTRRGHLGAFDHGAQYFTARSDDFQKSLSRWAAAGLVAPWDGVFRSLEGDGWLEAGPETRWVGVPGMNAVVRALSDGLDVRYGAKVDRLSRDGHAWVIECAESVRERFDAAVVAVPSPQAADLLDGVSPDFAKAARGARMEACWTVMAAYPARVPAEFDGARIRSDQPLGWVARDSSKPCRPRDGVDRWVIQATPAWSAEHLERAPEDAGGRLLAAFTALVGPEAGSPAGWSAHRWRYAFAADPLDEPCLWDGAGGLAVVGDWLLAPRVEAAFTSGRAAAERILRAGG